MMQQQPSEGTVKTPEARILTFHGSSPFYTARPGHDQLTPKYSFTAADRPRESEAFSTDFIDAPPERLSDVHLASRKAWEAAARRSQAASWLQKMVGPLDLPSEPSEEDLRLCLRNGILLCTLINKIHPGAVLKIVENPAPYSPPPQGAALSAYQYFENVRNFLVSVEELKLPSFQASDLEKGSVQTGSIAKVVDCILALKAYHEWQLSGSQGLWKLTSGTYKSPCSLRSLSRTGPNRPSESHMSKANNQVWPWTFSSDSSKSLFQEMDSPFIQMVQSKGSVDVFEQSELGMLNKIDFNTAWVQHVSQNFEDILCSRSETQEASVVGMGETANGFDHTTSDSLLKLIMVALHGKQPEEVPVLVEFMIRKTIEEFEKRLNYQEQQWIQRKAQLREDLGGSDCLGQQCEIKALQKELQQVQQESHQRSLTLDSQAKELKGLKQLLEMTRVEFQHMEGECRKEMEIIDSKFQVLAQAAAGYHKVLAENRDLYNQVQDLKGNIRVFCRVRPFFVGQSSNRSTVDFIGEEGSLIIANPSKQGKEHRKSFNFNRVFGPSARQEEVFLDTQPLIRSVLDGFNVCIFAYGQTGSGKTYTMTGPNNPSPIDWGVNFRALNDLFQISETRTEHIKYEVGVQMMEIYNEQLKDLLCSDASNRKLEIRNSSQQHGLNVPDASMVSVHRTEDVLELMNLGHKNRSVGATALNERSSRSHSVLTVHVKGTDLASGTILRGCLHLVDLAGSERVDRSEATGDRLKEAQHINKSLSALGDVIAALAQKSTHVPYRNSKLTQLLQDSLGGQAKTLMFVHVSPDEESYLETLSTLKFAERVASVELGTAHSNKESGEVRDLKDQISFLKDSLNKKDVELERLQKDLRSRSAVECQEKARTKMGTTPTPLHPPRTSLDAMQSHGKRRKPLEEVQNSEVRHSPSNLLSLAVQKRLSTPDIPVTDVVLAQSPGACGIVCWEENSVKGRANDDYAKCKSNKVPRQAIMPSGEEGRDSPGGQIISMYGPSQNRIIRETSMEPESTSPLSTLQLPTKREDLQVGRTLGLQNDVVTPHNKSTRTHSLAYSNGKKGLEDMWSTRESSAISSCSFEGTLPRVQLSDLKPSCNHDVCGDDSGSNDICTSQQRETHRFDECTTGTENTQAWHKEMVPASFSHGKTRGSKQGNGETKRTSMVKQSLSTLPKLDSNMPASLQRPTRSRRLSLVGGNNPASLEVKRMAKVTTTLEAKVTTVSSEGGTDECYAKATLPRQNNQAASTQKSLKRWM